MAAEEFDKRSFENIVWFYQDELSLVNDGARARDLFPKGLRKRLLDLGVLVYKHGRSGLRYFISRAAQEMLQNVAPATI